jgi:hypothetical protein
MFAAIASCLRCRVWIEVRAQMRDANGQRGGSLWQQFVARHTYGKHIVEQVVGQTQYHRRSLSNERTNGIAQQQL